jgi:hypothetical protein
MGKWFRAVAVGLLLTGCVSVNMGGVPTDLPVPPWQTWSSMAANVIDQGFAQCPQGPLMKVVLADPKQPEIAYIVFFEPSGGNFLIAALHPKTGVPEWLWEGNWQEGDALVLKTSRPFPKEMIEAGPCDQLFGARKTRI